MMQYTATRCRRSAHSWLQIKRVAVSILRAWRAIGAMGAASAFFPPSAPGSYSGELRDLPSDCDTRDDTRRGDTPRSATFCDWQRTAGSGAAAAVAHGAPPPLRAGPRFPSSRRFLWDRTPSGPQVLVDLQVRAKAHRAPHMHAATCTVGAPGQATSVHACRPHRCVFTLQDLLPRLSVAVNTLSAVARAAKRGVNSVALSLSLKACGVADVEALVQEPDLLGAALRDEPRCRLEEP
jgi:hypothetical protein